MERDVIRLECLRLADRHSRVTAEIVVRAGEYETFVVGKTPQVSKPKAKASPVKGKKTETSDLLG